MSELGAMVEKVRSKNAGPFWLTIDIFCGTPEAFEHVRRQLPTDRLAALFETGIETVRRFEIADLNVIKFSLPRPQIQGRATDRDMHGAGWAALVAELTLETD